ncbi:C-C motif chemokine 27a isoform X2 [Danio aesculapii]|uniref:C-C motif chemokine 27a isoform X2 n=1 Tax=Danio aesculapii TaxID=1142201 RepID=UPI0024C08848|nr:C-C motif chemokine 27a isoform X2 [Danio aesculapii]
MICSSFIQSQKATMEFRSSCLLFVCFTIIILIDNKGAAIPTCCLSVSHRIPKSVLRSVRRYEVQDRSGHCEIDALILHFKRRKLCAHPKLERFLKKMKKRRVEKP